MRRASRRGATRSKAPSAAQYGLRYQVLSSLFIQPTCSPTTRLISVRDPKSLRRRSSFTLPICFHTTPPTFTRNLKLLRQTHPCHSALTATRITSILQPLRRQLAPTRHSLLAATRTLTSLLSSRTICRVTSPFRAARPPRTRHLSHLFPSGHRRTARRPTMP